MKKWLKNMQNLMQDSTDTMMVLAFAQAKMKSARERNLCETTEELMAKYAKEKERE